MQELWGKNRRAPAEAKCPAEPHSPQSYLGQSGIFHPICRDVLAPLDMDVGNHTTGIIPISGHISPCCLTTYFLPSVPSHIRVYLPPLDSGTPNTYCSKSLEFQAPLVFNEVFRIPVHSSMLTLKSLQLYVCSVNPQLQEELLVRVAAKLLLACMVLFFPSFSFPLSLFMTLSSFLSPFHASLFLISSVISFYASFMFCIYIVWGWDK